MTAIARVTDPAIEQHAADVTTLVLQPRRVHLKGREPRVRYVCNLRKRVEAHLAMPAFHLLALSIADIRDGAPLSAVLRPYLYIIDVLTAEANKREHPLPDMPGAMLRLHQRETREEFALNEAQNAVIAAPDSIEANDRLEATAAMYIEKLNELRVAARQRRATLRMRQVEAMRA